MNLPQGYEPHEIPPDYTGPLFLESQMRAVIEVEREECAKVCEDLIGTRAMAAHCADAIRARGQA
jgi:hypothetical protein